MKRADFERFAMNDPQTYPQKMCTTENRLTGWEVTSTLQKPDEKNAPSLDAAGREFRERQKVKTYFLPVQKSKKGQAKLALFWSKGKETPPPDRFCVGSTRVEEKASPRDKPA